MGNRRTFLKALPFFGAAAVTPVAAMAVVSEDEYVAIPREAYDAIKLWQAAQNASTEANRAYTDQLRKASQTAKLLGREWVTAADKAECNRLFRGMADAGREVGPARENMIVALLGV